MLGLRAALIAQGLLWSVLCFFVGRFAASVAGARAGYCAAGLLAADVPSIVSSNEIMPETLFTALLVRPIAQLVMPLVIVAPMRLGGASRS